MAETMTMNRVIHGAVRRDLDRLAGALDRAPDGDRQRAGDLRRAYVHLHEELVRHHEGEDQHIFPALLRLGVDKVLIDEMDSEHHAMSEALTHTATAMDTYAASGSAADADAARASVEETRQVVERHLTHEEQELEPLMLPHQESEEWKQAEKQLRKGPVTQAGQFFAWVTDGMEPESAAYLGRTVPKPVTAILSKVFGRRYHREIAPVWRS